jgi:hypothetical protein
MMMTHNIQLKPSPGRLLVARTWQPVIKLLPQLRYQYVNAA